MNKRIGLIPWAKAVEQPDEIVALIPLVDKITVEQRSGGGTYLVAHFTDLPIHAWELFDDIGWDESSG